ncbi:ABC transporter involved in multi-copper enzyme maturation permease [Paenibacillus baekrokdamisoli]|uniref:ABC transporter involved in multi-copper enzyme maturation permease n=1 Tax=Paenibacillus baekrokdamisoli TaxID=1712516 RepID=A0A3G9JBA4_9BACL|nr:ABC transporter permease subunit [Paenibacillus baekrokdamisoli]MBB3070869.1 ABC-type transport system involved in multi-copper enzyme maturation permease subunit [Paenibacillus baekrokdamisoli]BBH22193.1 ABC transporter involved in multi-copper enzyme maturation permease [Paenibacillus baekrokdamisoli]
MMWLAFAGKELFRKKIMLITCLLTVAFLALYNTGLWKSAHNSDLRHLSRVQEMLQGGTFLVLGLFFAQMIAAFLVFFATMGAISGEIESGLMLSQLARPISRWKVYLGKYVGMASWMLLYNAVLFWAIVLPVHSLMHFPLLPAALLKSFLLFLFIPLLLLALSMLGSTFLPTLGNGVACAMLYGLSLFSGFAESLSNMSQSNLAISKVSLFLSFLMPSDSLSRRLNYEIVGGPDLPIDSDLIRSLGPFSMTNVPSFTFILYAIVYFLLLLFIGCLAFRRKDIT